MPNAGRAARDLLPDAAQADQAKRLVAHFFAEELLLFPLSLLHRRIGAGNVPRQREDEGHRQFSHADAVGARRVHHHDATSARGRHVDVVHASARARDGTQLRRRVDQRGRDARGATNDDGVGVFRDRVASCSGVRPVRASMSQPSWRSRSSAEAGRSSATRIFTGELFEAAGYGLRATGWFSARSTFRPFECSRRDSEGAKHDLQIILGVLERQLKRRTRNTEHVVA